MLDGEDMEIAGGLKTNLETIKAYIQLGEDGGQTDRSIIREACNNVYNYATRVVLQRSFDPSIELNCLHPGYCYFSKLRYKAWRAGERAGGIREHVVPFKVIRQCLRKMIEEENARLDEMYGYLSRELRIVWITQEEENRLNEGGFRARVPQSGNNRHQEVGISWHCDLVKVGNVGSRRDNKAR